MELEWVPDTSDTYTDILGVVLRPERVFRSGESREHRVPLMVTSEYHVIEQQIPPCSYLDRCTEAHRAVRVAYSRGMGRDMGGVPPAPGRDELEIGRSLVGPG